MRFIFFISVIFCFVFFSLQCSTAREHSIQRFKILKPCTYRKKKSIILLRKKVPMMFEEKIKNLHFPRLRSSVSFNLSHYSSLSLITSSISSRLPFISAPLKDFAGRLKVPQTNEGIH